MDMLPDGPYDPIKSEEEVLAFWKKGKFNKPEYDPSLNDGKGGLVEDLKKDSRKSFCIVMPPPNAYDRPHLGNVSGYAYQDLMGRYWRMRGRKTLLLPGKDHAGIQTEIVYERNVLAKQGKTKLDYSRDEFYKQCYDFCTRNSELAWKDEERVGISADFDRNLFTLDPKVVDIVLDTFIRLYEDGLVYKGIRITNWCPKCQTALSDADTEHKEAETTLTYIKYPLKDSKEFITIATTRPETMLADTAVAVNPEDKRYKKLLKESATAIVPLVNREVPIITDPKVDKEFGTGALKVTPAHAPEDYDIMLRWNKEHADRPIDYLNVVGKNWRMCGPVGKYNGMKVNEAREAVLKDLNELGLVEKTEEIQHNVSVCERCKSVIEPLMSSQWYIKIDTLRDVAVAAVKNGEIKIHPKYMEKSYFSWMENLRDWPISRSLWWGYRFPVWYHGEKEEHVDDEGKIVETVDGKPLDPADETQLKVQTDSPGKGWKQDEDVFDTWFSSGQWPFVTLMVWNLMDVFYPTDVMETMYDILPLWVSRMIMLGLYRTGKVPFRDVYLHGMLRAPDGQKMSKSKGNVTNMDDVVQKHGADTLRLFYYTAGKAGGSYNLDWERIKFCRNFLNKVWNASRFVLMNLRDMNIEIRDKKPEELKLKKEDKEMLEQVKKLGEDVGRNIEKFKFNLAADAVFDSFWHVFCDQYIEAAKGRVYSKEGKELDKDSKEAAQYTLLEALKTYLKILHPFAPFITESLWRYVKSDGEPETIMYAS